MDLGVQSPDPVRGLVDLASQVQVETSQHAQRRGLLVRGSDGSQGVRHAPGRAGDLSIIIPGWLALVTIQDSRTAKDTILPTGRKGNRGLGCQAALGGMI